MFCEHCGTKIENNDQFCQNCGRTIFSASNMVSPANIDVNQAESKSEAIIKCGNCGYIGPGERARSTVGMVLAWLCVLVAPLITIIYFVITHKYRCPKCKSTFLGVKNKEGVFVGKQGTSALGIFLIILVGVAIIGMIASIVLTSLNSAREKAQEAQNINIENQQRIEGVKITILKKGYGIIVKDGDTIGVNYTGKLINGTVFDSNIDPKFQHVESFVFTLGTGQVINGWDKGIVGMKVGEKRKLEISPELAYGEKGVGPIPPNATLIFEIELSTIKQ